MTFNRHSFPTVAEIREYVGDTVCAKREIREQVAEGVSRFKLLLENVAIFVKWPCQAGGEFAQLAKAEEIPSGLSTCRQAYAEITSRCQCPSFHA